MDEAPSDFRLRQILVQRLESLQRAGVEQIGLDPAAASPPQGMSLAAARGGDSAGQASAATVVARSPPVVARSPDLATAPTAGLQAAQGMGNLRPRSAGSGDPRTTSGD